MKTSGNDLKLEYEIYSRSPLFPNDNNVDYYDGFIVLNLPDSVEYIDIAETIKNIAFNENLWSAKIYISKTGYLMEIDSIPKIYSEYNNSYLGYFDIIHKGLNWKYIFKYEDINFNGNVPITIKTKWGTGSPFYTRKGNE